MSVGSTIKKLRLEKGMTQEELGKLLGVKKAAVQKYESGQVQNLKQDTIRKLCDVFGKNPAVFIFDNETLKYELDLLERIESTSTAQSTRVCPCTSSLRSRPVTRSAAPATERSRRAISFSLTFPQRSTAILPASDFP